MLLPQIQITQRNCNEYVFKDITPVYSPQYTGGYGGLNIDANEIIYSTLTLDFRGGQVFELSSTYNQLSEEDWTVYPYDLPQPTTPVSQSDCMACGNAPEITYQQNYMSDFPQGCVFVKYEVFSADSTDVSGRKSEGVKVLKFISTCKVEKDLLEIADKLTFPNTDGTYNIAKTEEKRLEKMRYLILSWTKLRLAEQETGCDCECLDHSLKQIGAYLTEIK